MGDRLLAVAPWGRRGGSNGGKAKVKAAAEEAGVTLGVNRLMTLRETAHAWPNTRRQTWRVFEGGEEGAVFAAHEALNGHPQRTSRLTDGMTRAEARAAMRAYRDRRTVEVGQEIAAVEAEPPTGLERIVGFDQRLFSGVLRARVARALGSAAGRLLRRFLGPQNDRSRAEVHMHMRSEPMTQIHPALHPLRAHGETCEARRGSAPRSAAGSLPGVVERSLPAAGRGLMVRLMHARHDPDSDRQDARPGACSPDQRIVLIDAHDLRFELSLDPATDRLIMVQMCDARGELLAHFGVLDTVDDEIIVISAAA